MGKATNAKFWSYNLKGVDHSEDQDVDGRITMDLTEIGSEGVDWMHLAQGKNEWWAHVNTVMKLRGP
jgi:hypothetical protein